MFVARWFACIDSAVAALLTAFLLALSGAAFGASWNATVNERGLPVVTKGGADALSSDFAFWEKNWKWAGTTVTVEVLAPGEYATTGNNRSLNFEMASRIKKTSPQQLVWEFDLNAANATSDAIGGGIVFKFDLARFGADLGEPVLLPGNQGWSWGRAGGGRMEMRFDPPLAQVHFEQNKKSELRAFFYSNEVPKGPKRHTATLSLAGDIAVTQNVAERFGSDEFAAWPVYALDSHVAPVDLSFLNATERPAGKRGFLKAAKDKLVFEDGTVARLWGTNLTANALFRTPKEHVRRQARRLSELGFNLVRLHHHDSAWVAPNIFGDNKTPDTQSLNAEMLDKIDWWIKCLKDEGIYVWLDLHVGRQFKAADRIDGFDEIAKGKPSVHLWGYNYVNGSIREAMKRFNEAYVTHRNSYTSLRYADDPAIMAMLITNENDVTHHFGNALLPDKGVPKHSALYLRLAETFAASHRLPTDKVWRSWEHGPSKLFLNDLEYRFHSDVMAHLRTLGVKAPLVTTNSWGYNPLSSLPSLSMGDIVDVHSYGAVGELEKNPLYAANFVHIMAVAQVAGKPFSVTEWNVSPFPAPDRHAMPLYVAGSASLQGWDALMQYAYAQESVATPGTPSNWHSYNDPSLIATLPAAALLYRQGHVREANTVYAFTPSRERLFNQIISADNSAGLRTASEKGKLVVVMPATPQLPWLAAGAAPSGATLIVDPQPSLLNPNATEVVSDSGELRRNWAQGIFTVDTPMTQAAMGWIGGKKLSLGDVDIHLTTRSATVAVQSLEGKPINKSGRILISLGAQSTVKPGTRGPFHWQPVEGQLSIKAPAGLKPHVAVLQVVPDNAAQVAKRAGNAANEARAIPYSYSNGRYLITLERGLGTLWLELR